MKMVADFLLWVVMIYPVLALFTFLSDGINRMKERDEGTRRLHALNVGKGSLEIGKRSRPWMRNEPTYLLDDDGQIRWW